MDVKQFKGRIKNDADHVKIKQGDREQVLFFTYSKTGYGFRRYLLCPCCDAKVVKLYWNGKRWGCRKCNKVNEYRGIQNMTKGSYDEIMYRMERYAVQNGITIPRYPFNYLDFATDARTGKMKFRESLKVLQALENMRFQAIFYHTRYSAGLFRQVVNGKHPLMKTESLEWLKNYLYDWGTGEMMQTHPIPTKDILKDARGGSSVAK